MSINRKRVKLITWTEVKKAKGFTDDNDGYEFGVEFLEEDGYVPMDEQWFLNERDMYTFINANQLKIQKKHVV